MLFLEAIHTVLKVYKILHIDWDSFLLSLKDVGMKKYKFDYVYFRALLISILLFLRVLNYNVS